MYGRGLLARCLERSEQATGGDFSHYYECCCPEWYWYHYNYNNNNRTSLLQLLTGFLLSGRPGIVHIPLHLLSILLFPCPHSKFSLLSCSNISLLKWTEMTGYKILGDPFSPRGHSISEIMSVIQPHSSKYPQTIT